MYQTIGLLILSFLIGGIPTGYIAVKLKEKKDIRTLGSGNIGFTNVLRVSGLWTSILVLIIDVVKAFLTIYFFSYLTNNLELYKFIFGILMIAGNLFSPYLKFKGGKGVATGLGVAIAISPFGVIVAVAAFLLVVLLTRYVSLASITAAFFFMVTNILLYIKSGNIYRLSFSIILIIAVILSHRENIKRLINGTENRIGKRKE